MKKHGYFIFTILAFSNHPNFITKRSILVESFTTAIIAKNKYKKSFTFLKVEEDSENTVQSTNDKIDDSIKTFAMLGLTPTFQHCTQSMGWKNPTPIQKLTIPAILQLGKNNISPTYNSIWSEAPTGSGKTGGYALPLLQLISQQNREAQINIDQDNNKNAGKVKALILVPTRELALQINWVFQDLILGLPKKFKSNQQRQIHHMVIHGGVPLEPQIQALASRRSSGLGIDILIATPGRLVDVLLHYTNANEEMQGQNKKRKLAPKKLETDLEKARDAALEQKLLAALDVTGKTDTYLTLQNLMDAKLDTISSFESDGRNQIHDMLDSLQYLVVDEADRLLGQPFQKELDPLLQLIPSYSWAKPSDEDNYMDQNDEQKMVKSMLFSATFPEQIQPRVEKILERLHGKEFPPLRLSCTETSDASNHVSEPSTIESERQKSRKGKHKYPPLMPTSASNTGTISLRTIRVEEKHRTSVLKTLLAENPQWERVLVFVATRYSSEHVARKLRRANISSMELHGKLDQDARIRRLEQFRNGKTRVLLATDLACRGLDIMGLPVVFNYDLPRSTADFTHRIGRTGRAGREGEAITFCTPKNEAHLDLIERRQFSDKMKLPDREIIKGFEIDEVRWGIEANASRISVPGAKHSGMGLAFDKMHGGVKGRRKSKKDKLREAALRKAEE